MQRRHDTTLPSRGQSLRPTGSGRQTGSTSGVTQNSRCQLFANATIAASRVGSNLTANGYTAYANLPRGQYRLNISGSSGVYFALTRVLL
jgi:hypothetical protein